MIKRYYPIYKGAISRKRIEKYLENMTVEEVQYVLKDAMRKLNIEEILYKYENEKIVDIKKHLNEKQIKNIEKLGYVVVDKIYTANEFERLYGAVLLYYIADDMDETEIEMTKSLSGTGVTTNELNSLVENLEEISNIYGI